MTSTPGTRIDQMNQLEALAREIAEDPNIKVYDPAEEPDMTAFLAGSLVGYHSRARDILKKLEERTHMLSFEKDKKLQIALSEIGAEFLRARGKFNPMRGPHEGYAVILEELDELWDAVKRNDNAHARKEAKQVAAMALAFMLEITD